MRATPTGDIENANLAEDDAVGERSEHRHAVVRDDRQPAALDDVQLLPDVALTADLRLPSQPASAATAPWPVLIFRCCRLSRGLAKWSCLHNCTLPILRRTGVAVAEMPKSRDPTGFVFKILEISHGLERLMSFNISAALVWSPPLLMSPLRQT